MIPEIYQDITDSRNSGDNMQTTEQDERAIRKIIDKYSFQIFTVGFCVGIITAGLMTIFILTCLGF